MLIDLHALSLCRFCNEGQVAHDSVASNLWWDLKPRSCSEKCTTVEGRPYIWSVSGVDVLLQRY